jgi:TolB protein
MVEAPEVELQPLDPARGGRPRYRLLRVGLVFAVVVATLVGLVGSGAIRPDGGPSDSDRLARIAIVGPEGGLSTIAGDGTDARTFPVSGVTFQFPAWSPDGSHVAAIGQDASHGMVFVVDDRATRSSDAAPIVAVRPDQNPIYLYWSPDGRRLAFLTSEPDGLALQVVAADGSGPTAVVRRGQPLYWDWIDGTHLLVHSGGAGLDAFLGEVGLDTPDVSPIGVAVGPFQAPGISSDGRYRAYVVAGAGQSASVVVEARDGSARHATAILGASALGWSPEAAQLAYLAPAQPVGLPVGSLRLIDAGSGATRLLLDEQVVAYFWAPDARTIAALRIVLPSHDNEVAIAAIAPIGAGPLAESGGLTLGLAFVDVETGTVRSERPVRLSDTVVRQFLPFFDQYALSHRLWSPASKAIVLPLVDDTGTAHITIVPADGSAPRQVADGVAAFWSP